MIRVYITRLERLGSSELRFKIEAHRSADGITWSPVPGAPEWLQFLASEILAITQNAALTTAQKKQALVDLLKARLDEYRLTEAEQAQADIEALITAWPVTISL